MSDTKLIVTKDKLDKLATSISTKSGVATPMTIAQMKAAVDGIVGGTITQDEDGYIVLSEGGSSGSTEAAQSKDVNFIDYDGTIVYSFTASEFLALAEMPVNPDHTADGLTAQGWNWTLADAQEYVGAYGMLEIGQMYIPTDGKTHIWIHIDPATPDNRRTFPLVFGQSEANGVTVNWGDGETQTFSDTSVTVRSHTYAISGDIEITLEVTNGVLNLSGSGTTTGYAIYGSLDTSNYHNRSRVRKIYIGDGVSSVGQNLMHFCYALSELTIPYGVTSIGEYAVSTAYVLKNVVIPKGVTSIGECAFLSCYALRNINLPKEILSIGTYAFSGSYSRERVFIPNGNLSMSPNAFSNCSNLRYCIIPNGITSLSSSFLYMCYTIQNVKIPNGVTSIEGSAFNSCYGMTTVEIPSSVTQIASRAFYKAYGLGEIHLRPSTPPTLSATDAFTNVPTTCVFYVPYSDDHSILEAYQTATNWSTFASQMQEESA